MENSLSLEAYRALRCAYHSIKKDIRSKLADSGITWPQFHALYHIGEDGIPVNELARELSCNASNITGLIDRMIENDWVYREHSSEDRRVWMIKLTDEGVKLKVQIIPKHLKNIQDRMAVLDEQEIETLKMLLDKLIAGKLGENDQ